MQCVAQNVLHFLGRTHVITHTLQFTSDIMMLLNESGIEQCPTQIQKKLSQKVLNINCMVFGYMTLTSSVITYHSG